MWVLSIFFFPFLLSACINDSLSVSSFKQPIRVKHKKSLKTPKGGNQNMYIEEEQTPQ